MSDVSLIPAVSIKFRIIPFRFILPSTMSLVVPGIFVTIAFSSFNKVFKMLLFPTFGLPKRDTFIPSFMSFPLFEFDRISLILVNNLSI